MNGIEIEGLEEFEEFIREMSIDEADEKKALRNAIKPIEQELKKNTPVGRSKRLSNVKAGVKKEGLSHVGFVRGGAFYDIFNEFGTSKSKKNIGYFEKSVNSSQNEAIKILGKEILDKIK